MSRYIDADALKQTIFAHWYTCEEIDEAIDQQPTADVKPVVRGEWIDEKDSPYYCSICGRYQYDATLEIMTGDWKYCPYCGADMRGDEDERE